MMCHASNNPFVLLVCIALGGFIHCSSARGQEAARYAIVDIGDVGGRGTTARTINSSGEIVGDTLESSTNDIRAFIWREGIVQYLDPLVPGFDAIPYDINDAGEAVGKSYVAFGIEHAVLWLADGTPVDLGTLGGEDSEAHGINGVGQVVGGSDLPDEGSHPFLWEDGRMIDLGDFGRPSGGANAINQAGQVVGVAGILPFSARAFLWENGELINLGTLPNGSRSIANDINNGGVIVGVANANNGRDHAVIWENRAIRSIHGVGTESIARSINESGQVVGFLIVGSFQPNSGFLYEPGRSMVDITSLLPPRHRWEPGFSAFGINDHGEMVGHAYRPNETRRGYLLTPVHPTLTLQGPQPGNVGTVNGLRLTGCTPGARVRFYYSQFGGGTLIPGCHHTDGVTLQLENPILAGAATANQNGVAVLTRFIPPAAQGRTFLIQALEPAGCKISQLVVHRFE